MKPYLIAADIGGSHISSMAINTDNWKVESDALFQTKTDSFADRATIIQNWATNLQQSASKLPTTNMLQLAIALPGPFDYETGRFFGHPEGKMGSLVGENLKDLLSPHFKETLSIVYENDAACFGLGEACFGVTKDFKRSIGITLGTGIGSSFIANQKIIKIGRSVPLGGEIYQEPFNEGIADDYFSTRWFVEAAAKDLGLTVSGVRELLAKAPTEYIQFIFLEFGHQLYQFLLPYAQNFSADVIVVGGNISKAWTHFGGILTELFAPHQIEIIPSVLNEQAIVLGVAKVFLQKR